jgi:hypothetical protein
MNGWRWVCAALLATAAMTGRAAELLDGKVTLTAFGEWGYGRTTGNEYLLGSEKGEYANTQFDVAIASRPHEKLRLAGQLCFAPDEVEVEWAFAEWRFGDTARLRLGKLKQPFGIYMEIDSVGTLRPFFTLPAGIYGNANLGAESYLGAGVTGQLLARGGWALGYDVYGGAVELVVAEPFDLLRGASPGDEGVLEPTEEFARDVVGGRLTLQMPWELTLRLSGVGGNTEKDDGGGERGLYLVGGVSLEWVHEGFTVRTEAFHMEEEASESANATYVEASQMLGEHWQVALRAEASQNRLTGAVGAGSSLLRHRDYAVGLNYWVRPEMVIKASYHFVDGNRFAFSDELAELPGPVADPATLDLDETTHLFVFGTQFTF